MANFSFSRKNPKFAWRMACGLGACLSCSLDTAAGRKKVCKDGPVFDAQDIFTKAGDSRG